VRIDTYLLVAAAVMGAWGAWKGVWRQAVGLLMVVLALPLSVWLSSALGAQATRILDVRSYVGPVVVGAGGYLVMALAFRAASGLGFWIAHRGEERVAPAWGSRVGGFIFGAAQVLFMGYALLSWSVKTEYETTLVLRRFKIRPDDAISYQMAQTFNSIDLMRGDKNEPPIRLHSMKQELVPRSATPTTSAPMGGIFTPLDRARQAKDQAEDAQRRRIQAAEAASLGQ
jgi:hypothetical protein